MTSTTPAYGPFPRGPTCISLPPNPSSAPCGLSPSVTHARVFSDGSLEAEQQRNETHSIAHAHAPHTPSQADSSTDSDGLTVAYGSSGSDLSLSTPPQWRYRADIQPRLSARALPFTPGGRSNWGDVRSRLEFTRSPSCPTPRPRPGAQQSQGSPSSTNQLRQANSVLALVFDSPESGYGSGSVN